LVSLAYPEVRNIENQKVMIAKKMKKYSEVESCPIRNVLDRFGDKWSMLILLVLNEAEILRFNEIHKAIGTVSQKMLSTTLKTLEADGLVSRKVYPVIPPRVEYQLTDRGRSLMPHLFNLVKWANDNFNDIRISRKDFKEV
jgi:DNA-binding HxlR family transcriptional regulator